MNSIPVSDSAINSPTEPIDISQLQVGQHIRLNVHASAVHASSKPGTTGWVGKHPHEAYPNLIIYLHDGGWIDPVDFDAGDITLLDTAARDAGQEGAE